MSKKEITGGLYGLQLAEFIHGALWEWDGKRWRRYKSYKTLKPKSRIKRLRIRLGLMEAPGRTVYEYKDKLEKGDIVDVYRRLPRDFKVTYSNSNVLRYNK